MSGEALRSFAQNVIKKRRDRAILGISHSDAMHNLIGKTGSLGNAVISASPPTGDETTSGPALAEKDATASCAL